MSQRSWDRGETHVSDRITQGDDQGATPAAAEESFLKFILEYRIEQVFVYREMLRERYHKGNYSLEVSLQDINAYNEMLHKALKTQPSDALPLFEAAAKRAADQVIGHGKDVEDIQITLVSDEAPKQIRHLNADDVAQLVKVPGIVISASSTRTKATELQLQCKNCKHIVRMPVRPGFTGAQLPRTCGEPRVGNEPRCPMDPYQIVGDKSKCVDQQTLKLQETPEMVPTGELPRHILLSVDRSLTNLVVPGTRVTVLAIYATFANRGNGAKAAQSVATRTPYLRVVGIEMDQEGEGRTGAAFTPAEEAQFRLTDEEQQKLGMYERISRSIAPSIFGSDDIKRAVACLLFSGSRKRLPDGMRIRGDINVLLLGDPGTAKSQVLKFAEKVAPIGVYTSGKGSSAAGLTASVVRDGGSREFYLEGGAMVLADGGIVCIDEFDKMRDSDRVAIHEAMEQQTISIAKAGITTVLNSRTAVLAAANSVFGRWDDTKEADENIEFQSTILSRFDMIFIVKDEYNRERDILIARHVLNMHVEDGTRTAPKDELDLTFLKKYINYCRRTVAPRLTEEASKALSAHFTAIRKSTKSLEDETQRRSVIPITVRQLEAIVRISESLAKMQQNVNVEVEHVTEAIRLFKMSTLDAATNGAISSVTGASSSADPETLMKIERQLQRRLPIGSQASEHLIVEDFKKQGFVESAIRHAIYILLRRGELQHRQQRKLLLRVH